MCKNVRKVPWVRDAKNSQAEVTTSSETTCIFVSFGGKNVTS